MKIKKVYESQKLNIPDIMKRSLEYYKYIDKMGEKLSNIISNKIEPLLSEGKFDEAKQMVRDFYKPSRYKSDSESEGDVIFIEYNMIMSKINRYKNNIQKYNI